MALRVSAGKDTQKQGNGNFLQGENKIELAHIYDSLQDRGDDVQHRYDTGMSAADVTNSGANNGSGKEHTNDTARTGNTKINIELSYKVMCLALTGILLFCTLLCATSGVIVYHVVTAKMADSETQTSQNENTTPNTNNPDALAMDVKSLKMEINQLSDVWKQQLSSLSNESRDFQMDTKNQLATLNNASRVFKMDTNDRLATLTNESRDMNDRLDTINDTSCGTKDQLGTSNNTACATKNQLDSLTNSLGDTKNQLDSLTNTSRDTKNQLETVRSLVQSVQEKQNSSEQQVAFTAHGATGKLVNTVLTFNHVDLNLGGGYNKTTGTFTCHVAGTYLFSATLLSVYTRSGATRCYIRKNAANVVLVYSRDGTFDSASVSVFVHLYVGDLVDFGSCYNVNDISTGDKDTSFIGSLIQAD